MPNPAPNGIGRWMRAGILACFPLVLAAIVGLTIMWREFAVAQDDIEDLEKSKVIQDKIIKELPVMGEHLENIDKSLVKIDKALEDIGKYINADSVRDAKNHHTHPRNP